MYSNKKEVDMIKHAMSLVQIITATLFDFELRSQIFIIK